MGWCGRARTLGRTGWPTALCCDDDDDFLPAGAIETTWRLKCAAQDKAGECGAQINSSVCMLSAFFCCLLLAQVIGRDGRVLCPVVWRVACVRCVLE